jgi:hypothetical protein
LRMRGGAQMGGTDLSDRRTGNVSHPQDSAALIALGEFGVIAFERLQIGDRANVPKDFQRPDRILPKLRESEVFYEHRKGLGNLHPAYSIQHAAMNRTLGTLLQEFDERGVIDGIGGRVGRMGHDLR